jgi:hypothetical protein
MQAVDLEAGVLGGLERLELPADDGEVGSPALL